MKELIFNVFVGHEKNENQNKKGTLKLRTRGLHFEPLESRDMLSITVVEFDQIPLAFSDPSLTAGASDTVFISHASSEAVTPLADATPTNKITVDEDAFNVAPGETFRFAIGHELLDANSCLGFRMVIHFDPSYLECVDVATDSSVPPLAAPTVNNETGSIVIVWSGDDAIPAGIVTLIESIEFKAKATVANTQISFTLENQDRGFAADVPTVNVAIGADVVDLISVTPGTNSPKVGDEITTTLAPTGATATYQWYRGSSANNVTTPIEGATSAAYTPTAADIGSYLRVVATGTGTYAQTVEQTLTDPVPEDATPTNKITVDEDAFRVVTGETFRFAIGHELLDANSCHGFVMEIHFDPSYLECVDVATDSSVPPLAAPTVNNETGSIVIVWSGDDAIPAGIVTLIESIEFKAKATVANTQISFTLENQDRDFTADVPTVNVAIEADVKDLISVTPDTNSPKVGDEITTTLAPTGATATYQWYRGSSANNVTTPIEGATSAAYTPTAADIGSYLRVVATGTGAYAQTVEHTLTDPVPKLEVSSITTSTNLGQVGTPITTAIAPVGATVTYQWYRGSSANDATAPIEGATSSSYTPTIADAGSYLRVVATGTGNYAGEVESILSLEKVFLNSVATDTNSPVAGIPITTTLLPGGATATYQWYRGTTNNVANMTPIDGATSNSYTPTHADAGYYLRVVATGIGSYTGTAGHTLTDDVPLVRNILAIGAEAGPSSKPIVQVYDAVSGEFLFEIPASMTYGNDYTGGVRVATGDLNGDGVPDIAVVPGRNMAPNVIVFNGVDGSLMSQYCIPASANYGNSFKAGLSVAIGDVIGSGMNDIILVPSDGQAVVQVFENVSEPGSGYYGFANQPVRQFNAFEDNKGYIGGASVTVSNGNSGASGDKGQIILGTGPGVTPTVRFYDVQTQQPGYEPVQEIKTKSHGVNGGINVTVGDLNGDGISELIVATKNGGRSWVEIYLFYPESTPQYVGSFQAYEGTESNNVTVNIVARDADGDGVYELYTTQGAKGKSGFTIKKLLWNSESLQAELVDTIFADWSNESSSGLFLG